MLPAGASGTWHGRFVVRSERGDAQEGRTPSERAPKPAREADEIPSLEELAAMLEGLDG